MPAHSPCRPATPAYYLGRPAAFWRAGLAPVPSLGRLAVEFRLLRCPRCGAPATTESRWEVGGCPHVKVRCLHRHWELLPADQVGDYPVGGLASR